MFVLKGEDFCYLKVVVVALYCHYTSESVLKMKIHTILLHLCLWSLVGELYMFLAHSVVLSKSVIIVCMCYCHKT